MSLWIINDIPLSVWEKRSSTRVSQSVFPNELCKPVLRTQMNGKARDGQEMARWEREVADRRRWLPSSYSSEEDRRFVFSLKGKASLDFSRGRISSERVKSLLYNLFSALGLSWPPHWDFTPEGDKRFILRAVSLPPSLHPSCLSAPPPLLSNTHTHPSYSYLLRAQELLTVRKR